VELALGVRPFVDLPVALVLSELSPQKITDVEQPSAENSSPSAGQVVWRCDRPHAWGANLDTFHVGRNRLAVLSDHEQDRAALEQRLKALSDFDLSEPFARIQEAVEEAHKVGRA
jgi:hypothetical protein